MRVSTSSIPYYKIPLPDMLEWWWCIIGKPTMKMSLVFLDETKFYWLNSVVDTSVILLLKIISNLIIISV